MLIHTSAPHPEGSDTGKGRLRESRLLESRLLGRGIDTSQEQWGLEEEISESPPQQLGRRAAQGYPTPLHSL